MSPNRSARCVGMLAASLLAAPAFAGGAVTPGSVQETVRPRAVAPPTLPQPEVERERPPEPPAQGVRVLVRRFEITGNEAIPTAELQALVAPYEGRELTLLEIYGVADRLTRHYRERGYPLATVTVPAQEITDGVVRLEVIEGRLGEVRFEGNRSYATDRLAPYLADLPRGQALRLEPLEDDLIRLNDLPGLSARGVIVPGREFGTSDLVVRAEEKRLDAGLAVDNFGRRVIGEWRASVDLAVNNPARIGDRLAFSLVHSEGGRLEYYQGSYELPLITPRTRAQIYYATYDYEVITKQLGAAFTGTVLEGDGQDFGVRVTHAWWRSKRRTLLVGAAFERSITRQDGTFVLPELRRNDLSLLLLSADYTHLHGDRAVSRVRAEFATNFEGNDGTDKNAEAGRLRVDASHLRALPQRFVLLARFAGVVSIDPLNDIDRFRLGGRGSVRAFPAAELAGDQGVFASIELQRVLPIPNFPFPTTGRVFYDGGIVDRIDTAPGVEATESLHGAGLGFTAALHPRATLDFELVRPFGNRDVSDHRDDLRLWAGVQVRY